MGGEFGRVATQHVVQFVKIALQGGAVFGRFVPFDQRVDQKLRLGAALQQFGGGGRALPGGELVGVHGQAHGAAGVAPLGTKAREDPVQPLGLGIVGQCGVAVTPIGKINNTGRLKIIDSNGDELKLTSLGFDHFG